MKTKLMCVWIMGLLGVMSPAMAGLTDAGWARIEVLSGHWRDSKCARNLRSRADFKSEWLRDCDLNLSLGVRRGQTGPADGLGVFVLTNGEWRPICEGRVEGIGRESGYSEKIRFSVNRYEIPMAVVRCSASTWASDDGRTSGDLLSRRELTFYVTLSGGHDDRLIVRMDYSRKSLVEGTCTGDEWFPEARTFSKTQTFERVSE